MDTFLKICNLSRLDNGKIENQITPIRNMGTEAIIKNLATKKSPGTDGSMAIFTKYVKTK